jgi:creatinine amidohydrolase
MSVRLEELTWEEAAGRLAADPDLVIMLPVGSTEQHGPHLPLGTDSINVDHLCAEAAGRLDGVLMAPCVSYGIAHNHIDFQGTVTLEPETLIQLTLDILRSLYSHGFRRFLIVNGHGGNNDTLDVAAIKARKEMGDAVIGHCYSGALARTGAAAVSESGIQYHADEAETSKTLAVRPDLVRLDKAKRDVSPAFDAYYHRYYAPGGDMTGLVSYGLPPTICLSQSGVMGDAGVANAEKGAHIVESYLETLVTILRDVRDMPVLKPLR